MVHKKTPETNRGDLTSIATEHDRTLFFDFMPIDLGNVGGMKTKLRLFTVPGQVFYDSTRKLVLQGTDGVIFVADSQRHKLQENIESLRNLEKNLKIHKLDIHSIPLVIQWNKRDMPGIMSVAELERELNFLRVPTFEAVAVTGEGVFPTLKRCAAMVLEIVNKQATQPNEEAAGGKQDSESEGGEAGGRAPVIRPILVKKPNPIISRPGLAFPKAPEEAGQAPVFKKFQKLMDDQAKEPAGT